LVAILTTFFNGLFNWFSDIFDEAITTVPNCNPRSVSTITVIFSFNLYLLGLK